MYINLEVNGRMTGWNEYWGGGLLCFMCLKIVTQKLVAHDNDDIAIAREMSEKIVLIGSVWCRREGVLIENNVP